MPLHEGKPRIQVACHLDDDEEEAGQPLLAGKAATGSKLWTWATVAFLAAAVIATAVSLALLLNRPTTRTRTYYVAADIVMWNYQPTGLNQCTGKAFADAELPFVAAPPAGTGTLYKKVIYRGYTDDSFTTLTDKRAPGSLSEYLGLLGPIMRAEVGDIIKVVFRNNAARPFNIEPFGMEQDAMAGPVAPGATVTYTWYVPAEAAPVYGGVDSRLHFYRSMVNGSSDSYTGLVGPIIITAKGKAADDGSATDVDREKILLFQAFDESLSHYGEENVPSSTNLAAGVVREDAMVKYSINGYLFCGLPSFKSTVGYRVRFHVVSIGSETDVHTVHFHGMVGRHDGHMTDQLQMQAGVAKSLDVLLDAPGVWYIRCHVANHLVSGMAALFKVTGVANPSSEARSGVVRDYFLGARTFNWSYIPSGTQQCPSTDIAWNFDYYNVFDAANGWTGINFLKARYIEYTDATFTTVKPRSAEWEHLGIAGPVLRAAVGDTLRVHLKNIDVAAAPVSLHVHGLLYAKSGEGVPYADGSTPNAINTLDNGLTVGQKFTYHWKVPSRAGPGPSDGDSVAWLYHSMVDPVRDAFAGLFGAVIITKPGHGTAGGASDDVDKEFVLIYHNMDEISSIMWDSNVAWQLTAAGISNAQVTAWLQEEFFTDSNVFKTINGRLFCNGPPLQASVGDTVRIYLMSMGSDTDLHSVYSSGGTFKLYGEVSQSVIVTPGTMYSTDMIPGTPGTYMIADHVSDHMINGQAVTLVVAPSAEAAQTVLSGVTRSVYIAAEEVIWDYAPFRKDVCDDIPFRWDQVFAWNTYNTIATVYKKARFTGYTDATFATKTEVPVFHGIVGPVIHVEVGDTLKILFRNNLAAKDAAINLLGALKPLEPASASAKASPGGQLQYTWTVPEDSGPGADQGDCVAYTYTNGIDEIGMTLAGMFGLVVVCKRGALLANGSPRGVDVWVPLQMMATVEAYSPYINQTIAHVLATTGIQTSVEAANETSILSNHMHGFNGYIFCQYPLTVRLGQTVRFYTFDFGDLVDSHILAIRGHAMRAAGRPTYYPSMLPGTTRVVEVTARHIGDWQFFCNTFDHYVEGLRGRMLVTA